MSMEDKKKIIKEILNEAYIAEEENIIYFFKLTEIEYSKGYSKINVSDSLWYELSAKYSLYTEDGKVSKGYWNVLCFIYHTKYEKKIFLNFTKDLAEYLKNNTMSNVEFSKMIYTYSEIFREQKNEEKELFGIFGELFTIYKIYDISSGQLNLSTHYHQNMFDNLDFYMNDKYIDVKTTTNGRRSFFISARQLDYNANILLVNLYTNVVGTNLFELMKIMDELGININEKIKKEIKQKFKKIYYKHAFDLELSSIEYIPYREFKDLKKIVSDDKYNNIKFYIEPNKCITKDIYDFITSINKEDNKNGEKSV